MTTSMRSAGITAAAVVVFLGSGIFTLICVVGIWVQLAGLSDAAATAPFRSPMTSATAVAVSFCFDVLLVAWGFATGVGLLRLRSWARASLLIIGGLLVLGMGMGIIALLSLSDILPAFPGGILVLMAVPALIGCWWLVYFNLASVRGQFEEYPTTGHYGRMDGSAQTLFLKPHPPLSIILIACMYLASVPSLSLLPFRDVPAVAMGFLVRGAAAKICYAVYLPITLYVGIGLLKLKPGARMLAIALTLLHMANNLLFVLLPGLEERMGSLVEWIGVQLPPKLTLAMLLPLVRMGLVVGLGVSSVILWLLVTQKRSFETVTART